MFRFLKNLLGSKKCKLDKEIEEVNEEIEELEKKTKLNNLAAESAKLLRDKKRDNTH